MKEILPLIAATSAINGSPEQWGNQLKCPVCSCENVHFTELESKGSDDYTAWEGRGSAIKISMYCEGDHEWEVLFGFHKGYTYLGIINERKVGMDKGWTKLKNPHESLI